MGRPKPGRKLADIRAEEAVARRRQFIEDVAAGLTLQQACAHVGIQQGTYEKWRERWDDFRIQVDIARRASAETERNLDYEHMTHLEFVRHYFGMMHTDFQLVAIDAIERCRLGDIGLQL